MGSVLRLTLMDRDPADTGRALEAINIRGAVILAITPPRTAEAN
jgi:hypothetical protein